MDVERCPSCRWPIIDGGPCPHCTSLLPGYHGPLDAESTAPKAPALPPASARVYLAANIVVVGLGLYWIVTAVRMILGAIGYGPGGEPLLLLVVAVLSLIVSAYTIYVAWHVFRRSYRIQGQLVLASLVGICWGIFIPLLLGNWHQTLVLPFYAALIVLALAGTRYFVSGRC